MIRIGIVAGEASGDLIGGQLIKDIRVRYPDAEVVGVGGRHLINQGCRSLFDMERLSLCGLFPVLARCFELLSIRRQLTDYFINEPPDIFIGIDSPDFNLTLEENLKAHGIKTVHYTSPSVWAWRRNRLKKIARAVDLMLVFFPFELACYQERNITAQLVPHPQLDLIHQKTNHNELRKILGIDCDKTVIGLMPGSRYGEIRQYAAIFLKTALWCQQRYENLYFVINVVSDEHKQILTKMIAKICPQLPISVFSGESVRAIMASDYLLLASGTITLEAMFLKKPMVVAARTSWLTFQILSRLVTTPYVALPNLLAGKLLVPECIQNDCKPDILGACLLNWLNNASAVDKLRQEFDVICHDLDETQQNLAVDAVLALLGK